MGISLSITISFLRSVFLLLLCIHGLLSLLVFLPSIFNSFLQSACRISIGAIMKRFPSFFISTGSLVIYSHRVIIGVDRFVKEPCCFFLFSHYCCTSRERVALSWSMEMATTKIQKSTALAWPRPFHWGPERA